MSEATHTPEQCSLPIAEGFSRIADQRVVGGAYSAVSECVMVCFDNEVTLYVSVQNGRLLVDFIGARLQ